MAFKTGRMNCGYSKHIAQQQQLKAYGPFSRRSSITLFKYCSIKQLNTNVGEPIFTNKKPGGDLPGV
jgi:hypothetical protein